MRMLKYFAVFVLLLIIVSLNESEAAESLCGDWEPYKDSKCFKILDSTFRTFEDAEKSCNKLENSPTLPMIGSKEEQEFLANFLFKTNKKLENFWLGAKFSNNKFVWLDNTDVSFTNWDAKGPRNKTNYCIQMEADEAVVGKWIDEPCEKVNQVVCQKLPTWSMLRLQQAFLESRKEIEEMKTLLDDARNHIKIIEQNPIQLAIPIGFIYVQLPSQPEPKNLWPKVEWKDVTSEYAGLFFRAEGGNATTFGSVQEASSPRLTQVQSTSDEYKINGISNTIQPGEWSEHMFAGSGNPGPFHGLSFLVSDTEVRPKNKAVRIWKRIN